MGVQSLNKWVKKTYPNIFIANHKKSYDCVYIDMHFILHMSLTDNITEKQYIINLYENLDKIIFNLTVTKKIVLAIDGASPYSKVLQRCVRKQKNNKVVMKDKIINYLHLAPGTNFMSKIDKYIEDYVNVLKNRLIKIEIVVIPSVVADEGDFKIIRKVIEYGQLDKTFSHLIIGKDTDFILLGMAISPINNIYLDLYEIGLISINNLIDNKDSNHRSDFVMLYIFIGNDYIPKLNSVNYEIIWNSYYETKIVYPNKSFINNANNFDEKFLYCFLDKVVTKLPLRFKKFDYELYDKNQSLNYLEGVLWCYNMYSTGICSKYDYIYKYEKPPQAINVMHYLISESYKVTLPKSNKKAIPNDIYPLILMSKSSRSLVLDKYQNLIDNELDYLYEKENCNICNKYNTTINALRMTDKRIKFKDITHKYYVHKGLHSCSNYINIEECNLCKNYNTVISDMCEDDDNIRFKKLLENRHEHKKIHLNSNFTIDDIDKIIELTNKL